MPSKTSRLLWMILAAGLIFAAGLVLGRYYTRLAALVRPAPSATPTLSPTTAPAQKSDPVAEDPALRKILEKIEQQNFTTATEKIDFVREMIYQNSTYDPQDWIYFDENPQRVTEMLVQHMDGKGEPPSLICGSKAALMMYILKPMGIKTRDVDIYSDDADEIHSHSFIEVLNPDTKNWEVQDPHYNLYYTDLQSGKRISAVQMVLDRQENIIPHSSTPRMIDYAEETIIPHLLDAMLYTESGAPFKGIINISRFNVSKKFPGNNNWTFLQFMKKNRADIPFIQVQGWGQ